MATSGVKEEYGTLSIHQPNRRADEDEKARLFEGLERFVNVGDSSEEYAQLAVAARSFWPIKVYGPVGEKGLDQPIEWDPAGQSLYKAFRDYLRRVWVGDFRPNENTWLDGKYLNYLLGLESDFTRYEPGQYIDAVMPDRAFEQGWRNLKSKYREAYLKATGYVLPEWGKSRLEYVAANEFQKAVFTLLLESWRARVCRNCKRYFIADKSAQSFCSFDCSVTNKRSRGLRYWRETGAGRRASKKRGRRLSKKGAVK
ncbi:MAG: hypothetical protein WAK48_19830 [Candidatus Acidiferrum sp.]|jgi:hypothetical protein